MAKRILYIGDLWYGSTALWRLNTLRKLGYEVDAIDSTRTWNGWRLRLVNLLQKIKIGIDSETLNSKVVQACLNNFYDALWIDKGLWTRPGLLDQLKRKHPALILISFSPDDMFNPINQTYRYVRCLPLYHHVITTKHHNVDEFRKAGVQEVHYVQKSHDADVQKKYDLTPEDYAHYGSDVGFIGNFEQPRFRSMLALAQAGIGVNVKGPAWERFKNQHKNLQIEPKNFFGEEYAKVLQATKINLGFLHKGNRDQHTARSIEIPACGGFLLAERTAEHLQLFEEGKEAEFFDSDGELVEKVNYYLAHEEQRAAIAQAGYERCVNSEYDNYHVFKKTLLPLLFV